MTPTTTPDVDADELRATRDPVHILDLEADTEFVYADPEDCRTERNADKIHRVHANGYLGEKTQRNIDVELAEKEPENHNYGTALHYASTHGLHPRAFENETNDRKAIYVIPVDGTDADEDTDEAVVATDGGVVETADEQADKHTHTHNCADCNESFATWDEFDAHDCTPTCNHCGATYDDLDETDGTSVQFAIINHQRACDERPATKPIRDVEGEWREAKREKEHHEAFQRKLWKEGKF